MDLEEARGLTIPTLLLRGSEDQVTPPALSAGLRALIRGSRLEILEGAGHMVLLEAPERVNQKILEFVEPVARFESRRPSLLAGEATRPVLRRLHERARALFRPNSERSGGE